MNSLLTLLAIVAVCFVGAVVLGIAIETLGWWLFAIVAIIVTLTVSGRDT